MLLIRREERGDLAVHVGEHTLQARTELASFFGWNVKYFDVIGSTHRRAADHDRLGMRFQSSRCQRKESDAQDLDQVRSHGSDSNPG
jgi:hypothetical protein